MRMDAAEYKHIVLGLIFIKYVSYTFEARRAELARQFADPESDLFFSDDPEDQETALKDRDYYTAENVFWVPLEARWETLRNQAKQPGIGKIVDEALIAIEEENPRLGPPEFAFTALSQSVAVAVHFEDVDPVGQAVEQSPGETFAAEDLGLFIERQIAGDQDRTLLIALAEDFEQEFGADFDKGTKSSLSRISRG